MNVEIVMEERRKRLLSQDEIKIGDMVMADDGYHDGLYLKTILGLINLSAHGERYTSSKDKIFYLVPSGTKVILTQE